MPKSHFVTLEAVSTNRGTFNKSIAIPYSRCITSTNSFSMFVCLCIVINGWSFKIQTTEGKSIALFTCTSRIIHMKNANSANAKLLAQKESGNWRKARNTHKKRCVVVGAVFPVCRRGLELKPANQNTRISALEYIRTVYHAPFQTPPTKLVLTVWLVGGGSGRTRIISPRFFKQQTTLQGSGHHNWIFEIHATLREERMKSFRFLFAVMVK